MRLGDRRSLIRAAYLLPLAVGIFSLFLGLYPHLFFTSDGTLYDSVSFFGFLENTRATCFAVLRDVSAATPGAVYFAYVMIALWGLSCLLAVWYAVFLLLLGLLSTVALTPRAAFPLLNKWKRIFRTVVPARGFFVFLSLVPTLLSLLPWLFTVLYARLLGQTAALHYDLFPDIAVLAPLSLLGVALYLLTLRAQKEEKIDLFRIYKV